MTNLHTSHRSPAPRRHAGFTLVELMVVVLITAILLAVGIPTYQNQVREARRTDAKTAALDLAAREEKYFSLNNTYTNSAVNLGYSAAGSFPQLVGSGYYNIYACPGTGINAATTACSAASGTATGNSFVVGLVPVAGKSQALDSKCQYFAVDNTGLQYATDGGGASSTTTCWH